MKKHTNPFCPGNLSPSLRLPEYLLKKFLFFSLILLFSTIVQAQQKVHVSGIVKDDKGNPAANASVTVKGAKTGVTTDASGAFSIDVPSPK